MQDLAEGQEFCALFVDVLTVDLVSDDDQFVVDGEFYDFLDGVFAQDCASGVARVDHHDGSGLGAGFLSDVNGFICLFDIQLPPLLLIQIVRHYGPSIKRHRRRIERVLRNGNHNPILLTGNEHLYDHMHTLRSPLRQEYIARVRWLHAIVLSRVPRNRIPH